MTKKIILVAGLFLCTLTMNACALCHGFDNHHAKEAQEYWG